MPERPDPATLEVVLYPDPALRRRSAPIEEVTGEIRDIADAMIASMYEARGIGLAANQVGWNERLMIVSDGSEPGAERVAINPEVLSDDGAVAMEEGCLSFPGLLGRVTRSERIRVRYTDRDGKVVEEEMDGLLARCFLHELDHLDGILFITKMTPADRIRLKRPLRELEEEHEERTRARQ